MKGLHESAKAQRVYFETNFPSQKVPKYSDFLKNNSPISEEIVTYDVSYQVSYTGMKDDITINPQTFEVIGFKNDASKIETDTMDMIIDAKGEISDNNFTGKTSDAIKNNTTINITPRGLESTSKKPSRNDINRIISGEVIVKKLDTSVNMKNRKGRVGSLKMDIRHFS